MANREQALSRITINPDQCGGRPCIRGMRIRVEDVFAMLVAGVSEQEILADFPDLEAGDIRACLAYAARCFEHPLLSASEQAKEWTEALGAY
jgi:uncharacterized protein (DUF433 family)